MSRSKEYGRKYYLKNRERLIAKAAERDHCRIPRGIAAKALGRALMDTELVHHVDYDPKNHSPDNLVICPDEGYHRLLHRRTNALQDTGNPNLIKCTYCKRYENPARLNSQAGKRYHTECHRLYVASRRSN